MPTQQQTFDTVVTHLRKQGVQSRKGTGMCMYRGSGGLMCAAGCLIPDDKYDTGMEGFSASSVGGRPRNVLEDEGHDIPLVQSLQVTHDLRLPHEWEEQFMVIACANDLKYTAPAGETK